MAHLPAPLSTELHRVTPDYWQAYRDLRLRALAVDPDAFGSTLEREQGWDEERWRERLAGTRTFLALVGGTAVGSAGWFERDPGWGDVVAMWVEPAHRGRGLGRLLLDAAVADVRDAGLRVRLWVADANPSARQLYERAGFVATGEQAPVRPRTTATKSLMVLPPER